MINALPFHKYKVPGPDNSSTSQQQASTSSAPTETRQDSTKADESVKTLEDELTCSICLEQVNRVNLSVACYVCIRFMLSPIFSSCYLFWSNY